MRKFSKTVARGGARETSPQYENTMFLVVVREDAGLARPLFELPQLLVWSSRFFYITKYLGKKKANSDLRHVCVMQQSRGTQLLVVQLVSYCHCPTVQVSYCHKILPS